MISLVKSKEASGLTHEAVTAPFVTGEWKSTRVCKAESLGETYLTCCGPGGEGTAGRVDRQVADPWRH